MLILSAKIMIFLQKTLIVLTDFSILIDLCPGKNKDVRRLLQNYT